MPHTVQYQIKGIAKCCVVLLLKALRTSQSQLSVIILQYTFHDKFVASSSSLPLSVVSKTLDQRHSINDHHVRPQQYVK